MPDDLAALHARAFTRPRPWSAAEFRSLLESRGVFLLARPQGFLMGRLVVDEGELLTLAVAPEARRQGIGAELTAAFAAHLRGLGAVDAFLEVASDNDAARALYRRQGWVEAGRRPGYYAPGIDALTLRLGL